MTADDAAGTITLELPGAFSPLETNLSKFPRIICPAGLDDPSLLGETSQGTGAFVLDRAVPGDRFELKAREGYVWGPDGMTTADAGFPSAVTLRIVPNDTTAANLIVSGELDLAFVDGPERGRLAQEADLDKKDIPDGTTMVFINQAAGRVGADPAVREALFQGIDSEGLTAAGFGEFATVAKSMLQPNSRCYTPETAASIPKPDLKAAEAALAGKNLNLKVYAISAPGAEYLVSTWRELGVESELVEGDKSSPALEVVFGGGDWDVFFTTFNSLIELASIVPFMSGPAPTAGMNVGSIDNPAMSAAFTNYLKSSGEESCEYATEALTIAISEHEVIPLSAVTRGYFSRGIEYFNLNGVESTSLRLK